MVKTADWLIKRAEKALEDPKLVEIAKSAPLNKDGRVNLSWAYEQAFQYVFGQTKDLQKAKERAVSTRWLTMLRRDHLEEFEKLVAQKAQPKPEEKEVQDKKWISTVEICLSRWLEITTIEDGVEKKSRSIRFTSYADYLTLLMPILDMVNQCQFYDIDKRTIINKIIQVLEEEGLKVRTCENCKNREHLIGDQCDLRTMTDGLQVGDYIRLKVGKVEVYHTTGRDGKTEVYDQCPYWIPNIKS